MPVKKNQEVSEEPKEPALVSDADTKPATEKVTKTSKAKPTSKVKPEADTKVSKTTKKSPVTHQHGRKFREAASLVEQEREYDLNEAIELVLKTSPVKFDATVEIHLNLGVDPRQADQVVRAGLILPAGLGKVQRVAVFTSGEAATKAKAAGADITGEEAVAELLQKEQLDFDVLIATPDSMSKLAKYAKLLGPRGLMPNPKSGTVTNDVEKAVKESKAGRVEFRMDKQAIVHQAAGKVSFSAEQLTSNLTAIIAAVQKARPAAAKGTFIKRMSISSTMGPGIRLNVAQALAESTKK